MPGTCREVSMMEIQGSVKVYSYSAEFMFLKKLKANVEAKSQRCRRVRSI